MKVKAKVDLFCGGYRRRAGTVFEIDGSPTKHMEVLQAAVEKPQKTSKKAPQTMSEINADVIAAEKAAMTGKVADTVEA